MNEEREEGSVNEEKMVVLRMLSEGKISVEEAEKLLRALGSDDASGRAAGGRSRSRKGGQMGDLLGEIGHEVRRAVGTVQKSEIGHAVRREIDEAVHRVQSMDVGRMVDKVVVQVRDVIEEVVEHASLSREEAVEDCRWTLDGQGVANLHATTDSGDIRFIARGGGEIAVVAHKKVKAHSRTAAEELLEKVQVNVLQDGDTVRVSKSHLAPPRGQSVEVSYTLEGPAGLILELCSVNGHIDVRGSEETVRARSTNGNLTAEGVRGAAHLRTQNGNISARINVLGQEGVFSTDNGNVYAWIADGNGALTCSSTNGRLELHVPDAYPARIDARTTNGSVESSLNLRRVELVKRTQLIGQIGDEHAVEIQLHTLNGDIRLKPLTALSVASVGEHSGQQSAQ